MGGDENERKCKLFVGGLARSVNNDGLRAFFEQWGTLTDCIVMTDSNTQQSRGFGYVTFAEPSMCDEAMKYRPHTIEGKEVETKRAIPKDMSAKAESNMTCKKLHLRGIKDAHTEEALREYFESYGNIEKIQIPKDQNSGATKGFAFIEFDDYDSVDKALLDGPHSIEGYTVNVAKSLTDEQKRRSQTKEASRGRGGGYGGGGYNGGGWNHGGGGGYGGGGGGYGGGGRGGGRGGRGGRGGGRGGYGGGGGGNYNHGGGGYGGGGYGGGGSWNHQGWNQGGGQPAWGSQQSWGGGYGDQGSWSQGGGGGYSSQSWGQGSNAAPSGQWGGGPSAPAGYGQNQVPQGWQQGGGDQPAWSGGAYSGSDYKSF